MDTAATSPHSGSSSDISRTGSLPVALWKGLTGWFADIWRLCVEAGRHTRKHWRLWVLAAFSVAVFCVMVWPHDGVVLAEVRGWSDGELRDAARGISFWGDFLTWTVPMCVLLAVLGWVFRKPRWRHAAMACLLAAIMAGATANAFRFTLGRPRPAAELPDGFYGLQKRAKYHGFPSGHAATAFGTATALAVALPPVGIPCLVIAGAVGWSRMELRRHYVTDIMVGGFLGILCGVSLGRAARRRTHATAAVTA